MNDKKDLLCYCGFYCGDCLGYTGVIADAATEFKRILDQYQFHQSAKCVFPDQLKDYDRFYEIVEFMTGLKCSTTCRERKDARIACDVRNCCIGKNYFACHECHDFETCDKLKNIMDGLHYEASAKNLKAIREMSLDEWISKGKRHHYWD